MHLGWFAGHAHGLVGWMSVCFYVCRTKMFVILLMSAPGSAQASDRHQGVQRMLLGRDQSLSVLSLTSERSGFEVQL